MKKKIAYFVGIKGVGMTSLAVYMKEAGYSVTGSDSREIFITDEILTDKKIPVVFGFSPSHIQKNISVVIVTGAHGGKTNPEAVEAIRIGLPVFMHGQMLGRVMNEKMGIAVSGCHGKTTTASALAHILTVCGCDPSYAIGTSQISKLGPAGHFGGGKAFIAEADEYMTCPVTDPTPRFLWLKPKILIITNIDYDHPDAFSSIDDVKDAYIKLTKNIAEDGTIIACIDNRHVREILPLITTSVVTYGFSPDADFRIDSANFQEGVSFMKFSNKNVEFGEFMLAVAGKHNMLNFLAASIAANFAGCNWEKIRKNSMKFTGSKRRFEKIGSVGTVLFYDDYAHHPSEIRETLKACRGWFPNKRIIAIFQPHTFSRTKALRKDFAQAFSDCNEVLIADIFPSAREIFDPTISSKLLCEEIKKNKKEVQYLKAEEDVCTYLKTHLTDNDLILTMGAGDIYRWHKNLIKLYTSKL